MKINSDFKDLLCGLNAAGVRYLIVGGYAVMAHTEPRYTKDLDVWIDATEANAEALLAALAGFGAPITDVKAADFTVPDVYFQVGVDPVRIDIMTSVEGLEFGGAWDRKITVDFGGVSAPVLCRDDLIATKEATGRTADREDLKRLRTTPAPDVRTPR